MIFGFIDLIMFEMCAWEQAALRLLIFMIELDGMAQCLQMHDPYPYCPLIYPVTHLMKTPREFTIRQARQQERQHLKAWAFSTQAKSNMLMDRHS